jgi:catechol 2,3-dioxygenase-like lactoylglutathione lyase family enzyme
VTVQLNAIALLVEDMERAKAFYRRLGLEFTGEGDHADCELPGGFRIMLDTHAMAGSLLPGWSPPTGSARVALAFQCDAPADVDGRFAELMAAGAEGVKPPYDAPWGHRYATLLDPDGNLLDLYAPQ